MFAHNHLLSFITIGLYSQGGHSLTCPGILISGGTKDGTKLRSLFMYQPDHRRIDQLQPSLNVARAKHLSISIQDQHILFATATSRKDGVQNQPELFNLRRREINWSDELLTPRFECAGVGVGAEAWVCGGNNIQNRDLSSCEVCTVANGWIKGPPMLTNRSALAMAAVGNRIFAIGGYRWDGTKRTMLNSVEEYHTEFRSDWAIIASMNRRREYASAAELNGEVFVCGGTGFSLHLDYNDCEHYNPDVGRWMADIASMNKRRQVFSLVSFRQKLYAIGPGDVESYDPATNSWRDESVSLNIDSGASAVAILSC